MQGRGPLNILILPWHICWDPLPFICFHKHIFPT